MKLHVAINVKNVLRPTSVDKPSHLYAHLVKNGEHVGGSDIFLPIAGDVFEADLGDHPDSVYTLEYQARNASGNPMTPMYQEDVRPCPVLDGVK